MFRQAFPILAAVGLVGTASGQVNWETRMQYRLEGSAAPIPPDGMMITATGTYTFVVQAGIFNISGLAAGEANHGVGTWRTQINSTGLFTAVAETLGVTNTSSRMLPFNFGPATAFGGSVSGGTSIVNVTAARDNVAGASAQVQWYCGQTQPTGPADFGSPQVGYGDRGVNSYADVYRFTVRITLLLGSDIVLSAAGDAGPIIRWTPFTTNPPTPNCTGPGSVSFLGITPSPLLRTYATSTLRLRRCQSSITAAPAPQTVIAGSPAYFSVVANGYPTGYEWRRNGIALANGPRISGVSTPTLTIFPTVSADAGAYSVRILAACGTNPISSGVALTVLCPSDSDGNGLIQPTDVAVFVSEWFTSLTSGCP